MGPKDKKIVKLQLKCNRKDFESKISLNRHKLWLERVRTKVKLANEFKERQNAEINQLKEALRLKTVTCEGLQQKVSELQVGHRLMLQGDKAKARDMMKALEESVQQLRVNVKTLQSKS